MGGLVAVLLLLTLQKFLAFSSARVQVFNCFFLQQLRKRLENPSCSKKKAQSTIKVIGKKVLSNKHSLFSADDNDKSNKLTKKVRKIIMKRNKKAKNSIMT